MRQNYWVKYKIFDSLQMTLFYEFNYLANKVLIR
jgi:intracellular septation protein A